MIIVVYIIVYQRERITEFKYDLKECNLKTY